MLTVPIERFRNFLRGMETRAIACVVGEWQFFRNFLRGMETGEGLRDNLESAASETSLEGWKPDENGFCFARVMLLPKLP